MQTDSKEVGLFSQRTHTSVEKKVTQMHSKRNTYVLEGMLGRGFINDEVVWSKEVQYPVQWVISNNWTEPSLPDVSPT